ncbi:hypothetical protein FIBSPDRAFT_745979 [Athelia psychrophila]|uniref:Uncharacterized protein n=1 Tax=Athelia psychrophila TaxID=1759441 RepID=A0A166GNT5_9AGAM|nr:hypothetical protein FIBSPDRAFT_745979 [Fibularhizoctonia sp. CBS 109695]
MADELGPEFRACVGSLLKLERAAGWTTKDLRLPTADRPSEFKQWMRYARPIDFDKLEDNFGERLQAWWMAMQPKGRLDDRACLVRTSTSKLEWGSLAVPGRSGIFLVVLGLYWWAQRDGGRGHDSWREVLVDVTWACEHIVKYGGLSTQGAAAAAEPQGNSKAARKAPAKRR